MITSLSREELEKYTSKQLNFFFPDDHPVQLSDFSAEVDLALQRLEYCFKHCSLKHYFDGTDVKFNHLYSDHYVMYLWYLGNSIWKQKQATDVCNKLYYLNKTLHGLDCMYNTALPDIFLLFHCSATMLGKATYSDFFVALQGCTVGSHKGIYPVMGKGVSLTAHSALIGNCRIGHNVSISAYTSIFGTNIPDHSIVFRNDQGATVIRAAEKSYAQTFFNVQII
ncbi:hypothetical protein SIO70_06540 [Chitinophaga sancti]|uniref:hypothetical protein n=1 Tax=Chitinophaga sancti TaxID=1004 RepID=UPI002A74C625|nr:hypothetical protein [Chitinophaga sancti]WPQ64523.1 hypothetical protein SIO70_06540 [Chitinophaga sancti]